MIKKRRLLEKIQSKYILELICKYIKEEEIYIMNLFTYSKYFQKKMNFHFLDYQVKFLEMNGIHFYNYLYNNKNDNSDSDNKNIDKEIIKKNLKTYLSKFNIDLNIIEKINPKYFQKYLQKVKEEKFKDNKKENFLNDKENSEMKLDINSPFFNILSKSDFFEKFTIVIPIHFIDLYKIKDDYINTFVKLNESKAKYSSLAIYYKDIFDLKIVKNLNINFNNLKELIIRNINKNFSDFAQDNLNLLFSLKNMFNNLVYLNLDLGNYNNNINSIPLINFKSLEKLALKNIEFNEPFRLELTNIKILIIINCKEIAFSENICLTLKKLYINDSCISFPSKLFKLKNIEECILINNKRNHYTCFKNIIDFTSFENLKILTVEDLDFLEFKNFILENIKLYTNIYRKILNKNKQNKTVIEKILSINTLKEIDIEFGYPPSYDDLLKIAGQNNSITKIKLSCFNREELLNILLKKLPNLLEIELIIYSFDQKDRTSLEIKENNNYKINKISLDLKGNVDFICFCNNYENIKSINIKTKDEIINKNQIFPIFNNNCNIIFKNLIFFKFVYYGKDGINLNILNNLCNNINKTPNLKYFELECFVDIDEKYYIIFIEKFLSLKLDKLIIKFRKNVINDNNNQDVNENNNDDSKNIYTRNELKILFPKIKYIDINKISILKYSV